MSEGRAEQYDISPMREMDIPDILRLAEMGKLSPWSAADYEAELGREDTVALAIRENETGEIAGFIVMRLITSNDDSVPLSSGQTFPPHAEILNITVLKRQRKKGLGSALIREALKRASAVVPADIWLEVRRSNLSAIAFYENLGFSVEYTRKDLYSDPQEDGFVMKIAVGKLIDT
jgi:[ribosomal protein S18]-alanine N-acetyltransferase